MRQAGIVAAGALHALDHHVDRLADDHANARALAQGLAELPAIFVVPEDVETNIVAFDIDDAPGFCERLAAHGVLMGAIGPRTVRAVTHLDVDSEGIAAALDGARAVLAA